MLLQALPLYQVWPPGACRRRASRRCRSRRLGRLSCGGRRAGQLQQYMMLVFLDCARMGGDQL
jgi:hypothetical protein